MKKPPYLNTGDTIAITSTARKISKDEIKAATYFFEKWGLKVQFSKNLFSEYHQFAGTENERAEAFQDLLDDSNIKAIICARGGYGTVQIIDRLNFNQFIQSPKWIIGYSDVTTLHAHLNRNYRIETLHAVMPINFPKNNIENESVTTLKSALFGQLKKYEWNPHPFNQLGEVDGELIGGNLSILYSLNGTNSMYDTKDKILFIEDLDEYLYHIDRIMMNLKKSNVLSSIKGMIVGGMSDMNDNTIPYGVSALEIIQNRMNEYNIPIAYNFSAGHCEPNNALFMGRKINLKVEKKGSRIYF